MPTTQHPGGPQVLAPTPTPQAEIPPEAVSVQGPDHSSISGSEVLLWEDRAWPRVRMFQDCQVLPVPSLSGAGHHGWGCGASWRDTGVTSKSSCEQNWTRLSSETIRVTGWEPKACGSYLSRSPHGSGLQLPRLKYRRGTDTPQRRAGGVEGEQRTDPRGLSQAVRVTQHWSLPL